MTQKAFRYRFYPTAEQEQLLRKTLGCTRLVYNRALAARTQGWYSRQERVGYKETSAMLTGWKKQPELQFLNEVSCVPLQQGLRHLQKAFTRQYQKLRRVQKALSRKLKGSRNREKARLKVNQVHAQIVDTRTDFLPFGTLREHKLTTQLIRDNQVIAVENLAVKNMVKNQKLANSISDASWSELVRQLEYKSEWYGRELVKIDRWFPSSKRCSNCGHIVEKMPLEIRQWECPECGGNHDRDINASLNILAAGLAVLVCGATVRPEQSKSVKAGAMKQKPRS